MKVLMGIGNELRGDDAIGLYVARRFRREGWKVIVAGQVPEDFTSEIKRIRPGLLVIVDAALMGLEPGDIRRIPPEKIPGVSFSTHGMPLSFLISYLREYVGETIIIGIQPLSMEFGAEMSDVVREAGDSLLRILSAGRLEDIPLL